MQSGDFIRYEGGKHDYLGDTDIKGLSATHRLYQSGDSRWVFIFCPKEDNWKSLCNALGLKPLLSDKRFETPEKLFN